MTKSHWEENIFDPDGNAVSQEAYDQLWNERNADARRIRELEAKLERPFFTSEMRDWIRKNYAALTAAGWRDPEAQQAE